MSEALAKGAPQVGFYRGHRDLALMMHAGAFNYVMVGIIVQASYMTLAQSNVSAWLGVQDYYENQLYQGYDRFFSLDTVIRASAMQNAQYNLAFVVTSQPNGTAPYTNQQVLSKVSGFLNDIYPSRSWSVAVYNGETSSHFSSQSCLPGMCLAATNLLGRYNVFAVGIPAGSKANTKLLVSQGWRDFLAASP